MPNMNFEGIDIHFLHAPKSSPRQRVLYIHGTGCNARVFERHMQSLGDDFECAAIDLPGHGESGGNGFRGIADYAASCTALVRHLGWDSCVVAGHSMGGGVALAVAVYDPDVVSAMMLIDTGARLRVAPAIISLARAIAAGKTEVKSNPRLGFAAATPDEVVTAVRQLTDGCDLEVIAKDWIADDTCDFMSRLPTLAMPTLAICGREDELTPLKYHEYLQSNLPDCELRVIDDAAHWPYAEQPEVFDDAVIGFLNRLAG